MLVVFLPTSKAVTRERQLDLDCSELVDTATAVDDTATERASAPDRFSRTRPEVEVPAGGFAWFAIDSGR